MPNLTVCPTNIDFDQVMSGVEVHGRSTHDGVSTPTDPDGCVGNCTALWAKNTTGAMRYAHFKGKSGTWRTLEIPPGFDNTNNPITNPQLRNAGFRTSKDFYGLKVDDSPNDPTVEV